RRMPLLGVWPTAAMAMYEPPRAVFPSVDVRDAEIVSHNRTSVDRDGRVLVADVSGAVDITPVTDVHDCDHVRLTAGTDSDHRLLSAQAPYLRVMETAGHRARPEVQDES